jgi:hypothetical protein
MTDSLAPLVMPFIEAKMGKKFFSEQTIRDQWQEVANFFHMGDIYKAVLGKPRMDGAYNWNVLSFTKVFENETYFWDIYTMRNEYLASIGKPPIDFGANKDPKSMALYNFRTAVRMNDHKAAEKYIKEYMALGGDMKGIESSARGMNPLQSMKKEDKEAFIASLQGQDKIVYEKGMAYYDQYAKDLVDLAKKYSGNP